MTEKFSVAVVIPSFKVRRHILDVICRDARVKVIYNPRKLGVGGAVMAGNLAAVSDGADFPSLVLRLIAPLLARAADFMKGMGACQ